MQAEMLYLQAQMVYLIRPSNIAGNLDELLVLWTFMYLNIQTSVSHIKMPTHLALPVSLGQHGNNAVTSRPHIFLPHTKHRKERS